jgi:UDP-GlcNAc:undecaprenyl-phosphate/decaprenyl-phosphate GlcNAc-1-phosphate transferase
MNKYLFIGLVAFFVGHGAAFILRRIGEKNKILMRHGVPQVGGAAIFAGFAAAVMACSVFFCGGLPREISGVFFASLAMFLFGLVDDKYELSVAAKFLVQIISACVLVFFGVKTKIAGIPDTANILITFIWLLGIANAFNHLDIIDGLAGMSALAVSVVFFVLSSSGNDPATAFFSLALIGSILSFLFYNLPPAKIYMGNSGSHFLGLALAAAALMVSYAPADKKIALLSPLFILGLPILDTSFLIWVRIKKRRLPFNKSNDHIAMRFIAAGYSVKKTLWFMSAVGIFFSVCGMMLAVLPVPLSMFAVLAATLMTAFFAVKISRLKTNG